MDGFGSRIERASDLGTSSASTAASFGGDCPYAGAATASADYGHLMIHASGSNAGNWQGHSGGVVRWVDPVMAIGGCGTGRLSATLECSTIGQGSGQAGIRLLFCGQEIAAGEDVSGTYVVNIPITFRTMLELSAEISKSPALQGHAVYEFDSTDCKEAVGGEVICTFSLVDIRLFDNGGVELPDAIVRGRSGTTYAGPPLSNPAHVSDNAPFAGAGSTWNEPVSLSWALDLARLPSSPIKDVWVKAGTYRPDEGSCWADNNRFATFDIPDGVHVYGHFSGDEQSPDQRQLGDPQFNSVLSGDLAGDDTHAWDTTHRADNAIQIARCVGTLAAPRTAVLDGLRFVGGEAMDQVTTNSGAGGGLYGNTFVTLTLRNCSFVGCRSHFGGGGFYANQANVAVEACRFDHNSSMKGSGGGLHTGALSTLRVTDSSFTFNTGLHAGAAHAGSSLNTFERCIFESNTASTVGALWHTAGTFAAVDCEFISNAATGWPETAATGAIAGTGSIDRCRFVENTSAHNAGACSGSFTIRDCTFVRNVGLESGAVMDPVMVVRGEFTGNRAANGRAGAIVSTKHDLPVIASRFTGNRASRSNGSWAIAAGAIFTSRWLMVDQCEFFSNVGGGNDSAGAIYAYLYGTYPTVTSSTFAGNYGNRAGAIYGYRDTAGALRFYNSIAWGNSSPQFGNYGPAIDAQASIVQGGYSGTDIDDCNPMFNDQSGGPGADNAWGTGDDEAFDLRLAPGSCGIDRGNNLYLANDVANLDDDPATLKVPYDLDGRARLAGNGLVIDIGAYELTPACPADFDGSRFVDTDDFTAFVLAFEAGTDDADFDGTGFVDTDDFTAFVHAFEAGC
ncbi:MAG: hypothetical protein GIKADHBN_00147 [Phycisphaerales bacterium]|nr:hypothetical protein [Phycisphaerales bacterium]